MHTKARNQRRTYPVQIPLHTLEIIATYKKTIHASDTTADTVSAFPLIATESPPLRALHDARGLPAAPWSMREVTRRSGSSTFADEYTVCVAIADEPRSSAATFAPSVDRTEELGDKVGAVSWREDVISSRSGMRAMRA